MVLCCAALCSQAACAAQEVFSIEDIFRLADENSSMIQASEAGRDAAEEALKAAKAQRFPDVDISVSASFLGNGRLWDRDFSSGMKIDIPHFGNNFSVEASQVVYAGGAIGSSIRMASLNKEMSRLDVEKGRQELRFLLLGYYLDLYKTRNQINVLKDNISLTEQIISDMHARLEQGTVLANDITRYELQKETLELQLTRLRNAGSVINNKIVTTLHLPEETVIIPDSTILASEIPVLCEQYWHDLASSGNISLRQSDISVRMKEQNLKMENAARLPSIAVVAADHLDGPVTIEVPVLNNNFNWWYVGIGVKYDLSALFKSKGKIRQARDEVRQAEMMHRQVREVTDMSINEGYADFMTSFADLST